MPCGPVSEQVYVHSKLLIIDDQVVIMGSANMNDRSMCGDRDSEIACVICGSGKYDDLVHTEMAGRAWKGARFAHTLRVRLWREHLGMVPLDDRGARKKYADQFLGQWLGSYFRPTLVIVRPTIVRRSVPRSVYPPPPSLL
jgi:phosphatidylserine/phosphatidylglycerophosphate/cardiolipin synthase-like enzyme